MYNSFQLALKYLHYYRTAANGKGHGVHSPFVFDFIQNVLNNRQKFEVPAVIEGLRKDLLKDRRIIELQDLGAGSRKGASKKKTIRQLAQTAVKPKKYGHLLYRLVRHYRPESIIELGTSLGLTTACLAMAHPGARVVTIEGSKEIFNMARENFKRLNISNIQSLNGNFDDLLPGVLQNTPRVDLGYVDGNHRLQPTLNYFQQFLSRSHNNTILVFDDIHWSPGMEEAWRTIKQHPQVCCTIDIFFLGFVFFRQEFKEVQHFTIKH